MLHLNLVACEGYISKCLFLSLIFLNLVALNNCYEVDGFTEFEIYKNRNSVEDYELDESQDDWEDIREEVDEENYDWISPNGNPEQILELEGQVVNVQGLSEKVVSRPSSTFGRLPKSKYGSSKRKSYNACEKNKSYIQRFVALFLKAVSGSSPNLSKSSRPTWESSFSTDSAETVKLEFIINSYELNLLKNFAQSGEKQGVKVETVSDIFTSIFSQSAEGTHDNHFDFNREWIELKFYYRSLNIQKFPELTVFCSVLFLFIMTLWLAKTRALRLASFTLFVTIFLVGFGYYWMRKYGEKEEKYVNEVLYDGVPYHCKGNPLAWYEVLFHNMFGEDCHEYYKTRDIPSMANVSPTDVLAKTDSSMIINPSVNTGKSYASFIDSVVSHVPIFYTPVAIVMGFIVLLLFLIIIIYFFLLFFVYSPKCSISTSEPFRIKSTHFK